MIRQIAVALALVMASQAALAAPQCRLVGKYEDNKVPVFRTADGLVTFTADVDVNTDGALQSYKIDDLGFQRADGLMQTNSALNTICNGVNIRRPDHSILYTVAVKGQCPKLIEEFKRIRDFGWLRDGENYVEFYAIALVPGTQSPPPARYRGKPCEKDGYYVSQVARAMDPAKPVCDPDHWVDAMRIPAIVLPLDARMKKEGVDLHDLVVIRLPSGQRVGAIVGDTNPSKIGEATVIANMRLKGLTAPPANYRASVALKIKTAEYIVFPGTKGQIKLSNASDPEIQARTNELYGKFDLAKRPQLCK